MYENNNALLTVGFAAWIIIFLFFSQLNWKKLLNGLFPKKMEMKDVVLVHNPTYMRKLGRIISLFEPR